MSRKVPFFLANPYGSHVWFFYLFYCNFVFKAMNYRFTVSKHWFLCGVALRWKRWPESVPFFNITLHMTRNFSYPVLISDSMYVPRYYVCTSGYISGINLASWIDTTSLRYWIDECWAITSIHGTTCHTPQRPKQKLCCLRLCNTKYYDHVSLYFSLPSMAFFLNIMKNNYNIHPPLAIHQKIYSFGCMCCL